MNEQGHAQRDAIAQRRARQFRLSGWAQFRCQNARCAVQEVKAYIEEGIDIKPFQAPNKCVRCGDILQWEGWSRD